MKGLLERDDFSSEDDIKNYIKLFYYIHYNKYICHKSIDQWFVNCESENQLSSKNFSIIHLENVNRFLGDRFICTDS